MWREVEYEGGVLWEVSGYEGRGLMEVEKARRLVEERKRAERVLRESAGLCVCEVECRFVYQTYPPRCGVVPQAVVEAFGGSGFSDNAEV